MEAAKSEGVLYTISRSNKNLREKVFLVSVVAIRKEVEKRDKN
jgi:hypothetical protein